MGPMLQSPIEKNIMIVATNYFTKWIEAESLSYTKKVDVEKFAQKNIICQFSCPQSLVTDNGSQFIGKQIFAFFAKYNIKQHMSTPRNLQGNGQAKASNKIVLDFLKKRLLGPNYLGPYGFIIPPIKYQLVKPYFPSPTKLKQSFPLNEHRGGQPGSEL